MKKGIPGIFSLFLLGLVSSTQAQEAVESPSKKPRTYMERFEPGLVQSVEKRLALKKARLAALERSLSIIDTLGVSERRKQALRRDLETRPLSPRLYRALTETQFGETVEE